MNCVIMMSICGRIIAQINRYSADAGFLSGKQLICCGCYKKLLKHKLWKGLGYYCYVVCYEISSAAVVDGVDEAHELVLYLHLC